jgi:hypothetical protein
MGEGFEPMFNSKKNSPQAFQLVTVIVAYICGIIFIESALFSKASKW